MKQIILILSLLVAAGRTEAQTVIGVSSQQQLLDAIATINQHSDADYRLEIEPGVYWLDNPDDPEVRRGEGGGTPFAQTIRCHRLEIIGIDPVAENTVLAVNRGQTHGAVGNFTMLLVECREVLTENITYGNYCNVDLDYKRDPSLSRPRRAEAICQAQLAICSGTDTLTARNCRFISRLNLCNFTGARRALFEGCHMECTDDALAEGIYRHCTFTFFSSKPFYSTSRGAWIEDSDIDILTTGKQYFTKVPGPIHLRDVRLHSKGKVEVAWCKENHPEICSAERVTLNGRAYEIDNTPYVPLEEVHERVPRQKRDGGYVYTFDSHKPLDTADYSWQPDSQRDGWYWGTASDGAEGLKGLVQAQRGARIMISPETGSPAVTSAVLEVAPCKSAGQGFGSATGQYMDVCVGFDTKNLTGYGLRIERSPDYDHAVVVSLVEYKNGETHALTEPEKCELYRTECKIKVAVKGSKITATLQHDGHKQTITSTVSASLVASEFMLQHTGTVGGGATLIKEIKING